MRRRDLMKAAPAVMFLGSSAAQAETPVLSLFREWEAAQGAEDDAYARDLPDEEIEAFSEERRAVERRLMSERCQTAKDFICKVMAHTSMGVFCLPDPENSPDLWTEARALIGA